MCTDARAVPLQLRNCPRADGLGCESAACCLRGVLSMQCSVGWDLEDNSASVHIVGGLMLAAASAEGICSGVCCSWLLCFRPCIVCGIWHACALGECFACCMHVGLGGHMPGKCDCM
jgi:hypothetical protein